MKYVYCLNENCKHMVNNMCGLDQIRLIHDSQDPTYVINELACDRFELREEKRKELLAARGHGGYNMDG